ncbi:hypothetical protein LTS10_012516 [Elasticomyces elasticus]|nr:hypothetical protein LTS10_012516 [Elasticomyces elasticus]
MSTILPVGYTEALHPITNDDHGGYASIASGCGLVFVLMFATIRLWNCGRIGHFTDDSVLFAGSIFHVSQSVLVLIAVDYGFGKSKLLLDDKTISRNAKLVYASDILYVVALFMSKISIMCLEMCLSVERTHLRLAKAILLFTCIALLAGVLMVAFGCQIKRPWAQIDSKCAGLYTRWVAIESLGTLAEIFSFLLILRIYISLQIYWKAKIRGLSVFGLRLVVVIFAVYRIRSLRSFSTSSNPSLDRIQVVTWTQIELAYSLVTATIPCLMALMGKLNTGWGTLTPQTVIAQSQLDSQKVTAGTYELHSFKRGDKARSQNNTLANEPSDKWTISAPQADGRSIASDDSTGRIIKRTVEIEITTEQANMHK